MKSLRFIGLIILHFTVQASAQTSAQLVSNGRSYLAAHDIINANAQFSSAVAASPSDPTANTFYAASRLLVLPVNPAGQTFLTQLGFPAPGRSIYHWTAAIPRDNNNVYLAPSGVSASLITGFLRNTALPEITGAATNLAQITSTNFLINLSSNETTTTDVTLDYGDILMLRSILHAMEYYSYTLAAQNVDVQLSILRTLAVNHTLSIEELLTDNPQLLTFATTNDMIAAQAAFSNAVDRYQDASAFIRARPSNVTRLFNLAPGEATSEQGFRQRLADLKTSLNGPTQMSKDPSLTFNMGTQFSSASTWRSLLPQFKTNRVVLGTLPDPTLGGVLIGHSQAEVEQQLVAAWRFPSVPSVGNLTPPISQPFGFSVNAAANREYIVQATTDLTTWTNVAAFVAVDATAPFVETAPNLSKRFYRVLDSTGNLPRPANDNFANATVLNGNNFTVLGYNIGATTESGESAVVRPPLISEAGYSVWYAWTPTISGVFSVVLRPVSSLYGGRFIPQTAVFTGSTLAGLTWVFPAQTGSVSFPVVSGTTYRIIVDGTPAFPGGANVQTTGGFILSITQPPQLTSVTPPAGATFTAPATVTVAATASDPDGSIASVTFAISGFGDLFSPILNLNSIVTSPPYNISLPNLAAGTYYVTIRATDNQGATASTFFGFIVN